MSGSLRHRTALHRTDRRNTHRNDRPLRVETRAEADNLRRSDNLPHAETPVEADLLRRNGKPLSVKTLVAAVIRAAVSENPNAAGKVTR